MAVRSRQAGSTAAAETREKCAAKQIRADFKVEEMMTVGKVKRDKKSLRIFSQRPNLQCTNSKRLDKDGRKKGRTTSELVGKIG